MDAFDYMPINANGWRQRLKKNLMSIVAPNYNIPSRNSIKSRIEKCTKMVNPLCYRRTWSKWYCTYSSDDWSQTLLRQTRIKELHYNYGTDFFLTTTLWTIYDFISLIYLINTLNFVGHKVVIIVTTEKLYGQTSIRPGGFISTRIYNVLQLSINLFIFINTFTEYPGTRSEKRPSNRVLKMDRSDIPS